MKGVVLVAAAVVAALLFGTAASPAARSGFHGRVCRGSLPVHSGAPTVCVPQRLVFLLVRPGRRYVVRSAVDGRYVITLPPGVYRAELPAHVGVMLSILRPASVRVRAGHDDRLDFYVQFRSAVEAPRQPVR
jgi:hypothetical protein